MKTRLYFTAISLSFFVFACSGSSGGSSAPGSPAGRYETIKVDQFGYPPESEKIAIVSTAVEGYDAHNAHVFSPGDTYELRHFEDGRVVYSGTVSAFNAGEVDTTSGDKVWYFDFSEYTGNGLFYVHDPENGISSYPFEIGPSVYHTVLVQAVRTFFYQRAGFAKHPPYTPTYWKDDASHPQDAACTLIGDDSAPRNLSGGWYDAGDFNKYVNYADGALHDLLFAYSEAPEVFGDDYGIPESGNGTPDLLDEIKYELDWLLKMQLGDGSLLHKVASVNWNATTPPSTDTVPRRYAPATASATASGAGVFAHGALVFGKVNGSYADLLETAAVAAWDYLTANPTYSEFNNAGFVNSGAEDTIGDQAMNRLNAAVYLYALTGETVYHDYILAHYTDTTMMGSDYLMADGLSEESQNALLYYASLPGANASLAAAIRTTYMDLLSSPYNDFAPVHKYGKDGYLSPIDVYTWGSNRAKSHAGSALLNPVVYGITEKNTTLEKMAQGYLNYLHGRNPMNLVYLSNMGDFGAENSVDQFYHMWFRDGSIWDSVTDSYGPPPGYLVGGPNEQYEGGQLMEGTTQTIASQPPAKSYRSWNDMDENISYQITENSITYQAAYIRLLAKFVSIP